jgi:hypothetical protein
MPLREEPLIYTNKVKKFEIIEKKKRALKNPISLSLCLPLSLCLSLFAVLGFELRVLHLLGRCSITTAMFPGFFALSYFQTWSHAFCLG